MRRLRHPRGLTAEERRLWAQVLRGVTPFRGRVVPEPSGPAPAAADAATVPKPTARLARVPERPGAPALPPLVPLERRVRTGLRRGTRAVEAAIDLHGLRQDEAHRVLVAFLRRSQLSGHSVVLVVTGKGAPAAAVGAFDERGILRRVVPHWLRLPELRPLVVGFEEAEPQHGGAGALYVRLRRRRPGP